MPSAEDTSTDPLARKLSTAVFGPGPPEWYTPLQKYPIRAKRFSRTGKSCKDWTYEPVRNIYCANSKEAYYPPLASHILLRSSKLSPPRAKSAPSALTISSCHFSQPTERWTQILEDAKRDKVEIARRRELTCRELRTSPRRGSPLPLIERRVSRAETSRKAMESRRGHSKARLHRDGSFRGVRNAAVVDKEQGRIIGEMASMLKKGDWDALMELYDSIPSYFSKDQVEWMKSAARRVAGMEEVGDKASALESIARQRKRSVVT